jgi:tetratricopeptide (TPR) repeat protein
LAEFEQARLRDPQMVLAHLDAAIAQTILGRFEDAESGFQAFLAERPDDPLPYLFLAVAHYRRARDDASFIPRAQENLDKAEQALARSGRVDRSLEAHIKFYRGLVYLLQKDTAAAKQVLTEGYELAPDSDVGQQSKAILDKLVERRPWEFSIRAGFDYDTNVTLKGDDVRRRGDLNEGEDWRFGLATEFSYLLVDKEDLALGFGLNSYNSWHTSVSEFNVQNYGANVFAAYTPPDVDWLTLGLRYDWDYTFVGNESFLARHRLTPQITVQEAEWTNTTFFYQFDSRDYHNQPSDPRLDRDGDRHAVGVIQRFELAELYERPLMLDLGYRFENVDADGTEFASLNDVFTLGVGVPLPWDMTFDFQNEFELDRYKHRSIFDRRGRHRRDLVHTMIFALTKQFNEQLSARFQIDVTNADSNTRDDSGQQFFEYDRVVYGLSVKYSF